MVPCSTCQDSGGSLWLMARARVSPCPYADLWPSCAPDSQARGVPWVPLSHVPRLGSGSQHEGVHPVAHVLVPRRLGASLHFKNPGQRSPRSPVSHVPIVPMCQGSGDPWGLVTRRRASWELMACRGVSPCVRARGIPGDW